MSAGNMASVLPVSDTAKQGPGHRHTFHFKGVKVDMFKMNRICVFCGSHYGGHARFERAAYEVGTTLAEKKIGIVYTGGRIGLMGVLADAALAKGGEVIGVMPRMQKSRQIAHRGLTQLIEVESRAERKEVIAEISDAFIALPGGIGALNELTEMALWTQIGRQAKPCGMLNVSRYFDHLIAYFDLCSREGFLKPEQRRAVLDDTDLDRLLIKMRNWTPLEEADVALGVHSRG